MNSTMMNTAELKNNLAHFSGSCEWYRHGTGLVYTDGVRYLAEHAGAYWLIDAVASYQSRALDVKAGGFQLWTLTQTAAGGAVLECRSDSTSPVLVRQEIEYTDFPLSGIRLYVEGTVANRCLMLPSER